MRLLSRGSGYRKKEKAKKKKGKIGRGLSCSAASYSRDVYMGGNTKCDLCFRQSQGGLRGKGEGIERERGKR